MAQTSEHGRIIAAAAKAALAPIGCVRKGQSRIWQSDHRYWAINVEFQPSGWQKGTYLNIFVAWLWNVTHGYDFSYRAGFFIPFETVEQFTPPMKELATIAATEVLKVREKFKSFSDIVNHVKVNNRRAPWPGFDAAVACGLVGDIIAARQYFDQVEAWNADAYPWQKKNENGRNYACDAARSSETFSRSSRRMHRSAPPTHAPAARPALPRCTGFHSSAITRPIFLRMRWPLIVAPRFACSSMIGTPIPTSVFSLSSFTLPADKKAPPVLTS